MEIYLKFWIFMLWTCCLILTFHEIRGIPIVTDFSNNFNTVMKEFWKWRLRQVPEFATSIGVHDYDTTLESFTFEAFDHRLEKCEEFMNKIDQMSWGSLSPLQKQHVMLLRDDLQTYIQGHRWSRQSMLNPMNYLEGIHKDYTFWLDSMKFTNEDDYRNYTYRLRALTTQVHEQIELMREGIRTGWMNHRISVAAIPSEINDILKDPQHTPFYRPLNDTILHVGFTLNKIDRIRGEGTAVIEGQVLPAFTKLKNFLTNEYIPNCRNGIGISSLSDGYQYYRSRIAWHLSVDKDPQELHLIGEQEIEKIKKRIDDIRQGAGFYGTLDEFVNYMDTSPKFYAKTQSGLLLMYQSIMSDKIQPNLYRIVKNVSIPPISIQPMMFDGPLGINIPPSEDGLMPGILFVNTQNPRKYPRWKMVSIALSEGIPGHHLQTCYAQNQSLTIFQRYTEVRKMYSIPFQFPYKTAYSEGWSLYAATELGYDMEVIKNPFDQLGPLFSDLLHSSRLVVDTGIHAMGWGKHKAIRYLVDTAYLSRKEAEEEVKKIITLPAHSIAPKMGQLKILQLRRKAQQELGETFDLRQFHHQILKLGPVPLRLLDHSVGIWIRRMSPSQGNTIHSSNFVKHVVWFFTVVFVSALH